MTEQVLMSHPDGGVVDPQDEAAIHALLVSTFGEPAPTEDEPVPESDEFAAEELPADFWSERPSRKRPSGRGDSPRPAASRRSVRRREATRVRRRKWRELSDQGVEICSHWAEKPTGWVPSRTVRRQLVRLHEAGRVAVTMDEAKSVWAAVDTQTWRADRYWRTLAVMIALHRLTAWETGLIQATQARIAEVADWLLGQWAATEGHPVARLAARNQAMTQQRISDVLAWAEREGLLVCLQRGASKTILQASHGRAGAYVLLLPAATNPEGDAIDRASRSQAAQPKEAKPVPPEASALGTDGVAAEAALSTNLTETTDHPYYGKIRSDKDRYLAPGISRARGKRRGDPLWNRRVSTSAREQEKLTDRIRQHLAWKDVTTLRLHRHLVEFYEAGWCGAAIMHAYDYRPDGTYWWNRTNAIRSRAGVVRHRLSAWRDEDGAVMAPPIPAVPKYARASTVDLSYVKPPMTDTPYLGDVDTEARRRDHDSAKRTREEQAVSARQARDIRNARTRQWARASEYNKQVARVPVVAPPPTDLADTQAGHRVAQPRELTDRGRAARNAARAIASRVGRKLRIGMADANDPHEVLR